MRRFLLILVLIAGGAAALVHGLDIRRQLKAQLESGFSGSVRTLFVAISPQSQAQLDWYRSLSLWLIAGGSGALLLGLLAGYERERAKRPARSDPKDPKKRRKAEKPSR